MGAFIEELWREVNEGDGGVWNGWARLNDEKRPSAVNPPTPGLRVADPLGAVRRMLERAVEDRSLDLPTDPVRMWTLQASPLLDQRRDPTDLEGAPDLVEGVAVVAHDAASVGHVT